MRSFPTRAACKEHARTRGTLLCKALTKVSTDGPSVVAPKGRRRPSRAPKGRRPLATPKIHDHEPMPRSHQPRKGVGHAIIVAAAPTGSALRNRLHAAEEVWKMRGSTDAAGDTATAANTEAAEENSLGLAREWRQRGDISERSRCTAHAHAAHAHAAYAAHAHAPHRRIEA